MTSGGTRLRDRQRRQPFFQVVVHELHLAACLILAGGDSAIEGPQRELLELRDTSARFLLGRALQLAPFVVARTDLVTQQPSGLFVAGADLFAQLPPGLFVASADLFAQLPPGLFVAGSDLFAQLPPGLFVAGADLLAQVRIEC